MRSSFIAAVRPSGLPTDARPFASVLVLSTLVACGKPPPPAATDASAADAGAAASSTLRDALVPLATACTWDISEGMNLCPAFDAFGKKHADTPSARAATSRACLALVADADVKMPAATCARYYAERDLREPILAAFEGTTDRSVRLELALALKKLRAPAPLEARVIALVRKGPSNEPYVRHLLGALHPDDESKEPSAEAFAVAKDLVLAPALNIHGAASSVLEATPSRRAEYCTIMGQKIGTDVRTFSWEGDWIFPRLTPYPECDKEVARLLPVLVSAIKAFAEGERPAWSPGDGGLHFVGMLEDSRPLKADQRRAVAAALDAVARGSERDRKSATSLAERYRK